MASIKERGTFWRAEVRRKGYKPVYRTFDTQKQAQQWARRIETEMDSGLYEAERTTPPCAKHWNGTNAKSCVTNDTLIRKSGVSNAGCKTI